MSIHPTLLPNGFVDHSREIATFNGRIDVSGEPCAERIPFRYVKEHRQSPDNPAGQACRGQRSMELFVGLESKSCST